MSDPQAAKKAMRAQLQEARLARSDADRAAANEAIVSSLVSLIQSKGFRAVSAYCAFEEEPGGPGLVDALLPHVDELWVPLSRPKGILEGARYTGPECLCSGAYGIPEPTGEATGSEILSLLDLVIVPALGATPQGQRLGKGAGYYDRALEPLPPVTPVQVAVLFDAEVRADIPFAPHDATIPFILTEKGLRTTS